MDNLNRGLTLIELMVVIAIIGLLASIVLASLNTSRNRAANSAIVSNMQTIVSTANLYYSNTDSYGTAFLARSTAGYCVGGAHADPDIFDDPKVQEALNVSIALNPSANPGCAVGPSGQTWAVSMPLKGGGYWCVSSSGAAGFGNAAGGGPSDADCSGAEPPCDEGLGCVLFEE